MFKPFKNIRSKPIIKKCRAFFQPKLAINPPNDIYEQEADAMAERVVNKPASENNHSFFKPSVVSMQRKCAQCEEEEKNMQRKEKSSGCNECTCCCRKLYQHPYRRQCIE
jgi:hypothetical protein